MLSPVKERFNLRLKVWSNKAELQFAVEIEILGKVRHKNLLSLRGYCAEGQERLIARVADFGFAKLIPDGATHVTTKVKGTHGYLAPEYAMYGKASESCDVYSFGIVLLELASGKKSIEKPSPTVKLPITEWALPLARERKFKEIADPKLNGNYVEAELKRMVLVALICAQSMPENRPTMLEVVDLLKGESKENLTDLENNEMFRPEPAGISQVLSGPNGSSDFVSKEKNSEANANEMGS
ncbi:hypothetical protein BHE74_00006244 [Ensete ventricosum]|nr:hypothetical protein BHE74_00006244 [Ensete ventricosum]